MFRKKLEDEGIRKELNELRERVVLLEIGQDDQLRSTNESNLATWTTLKLANTAAPKKKGHIHVMKPYYSRKKCTECGHITRRYKKRSK